MNPVTPRVVIEGVDPEIDGGLFPIKRTVGEEVEIRADAYADGHDALAVVLRYRQGGSPDWTETSMTALGNDRWKARFRVLELGRYEYTLQAWIDRFATWRKELSKKAEAGQDVASELLEGAELLTRTARQASAADAHWIRERAVVVGGKSDQAVRVQAALDPPLAEVMARNADRTLGTVYERILIITVEQERARYGAWYELFPRSCAADPGSHGTFKDCEKRLSYVAGMGFDVL
jgi:starch synthase (maltosyl-transferring)